MFLITFFWKYEYIFWIWKPVGKSIKTFWSRYLNQDKIWEEYPRPQLQRKEWINLNGPWKYSIRNKTDAYSYKYDGFILVPFPIESSLSGVMRTFAEEHVLWYEREFYIPKKWKGKHILLNFGAVDWMCEIYINQIRIGNHTGGYSYFYFDITNYLNRRGNKIILKVIDFTNSNHSEFGDFQPIGKQSLNPDTIFYTACSGIWQTVWIEPVDENYIEKLEINNDYDNKEIKLLFKVPENKKFNLIVSVKFNNQLIAFKHATSNEELYIKLSEKDFNPWSPYQPNLYTISAKLLSKTGQILDSITSYTALRKVESKKDKNGILRIFLNDKPIFNLGTLDQGYWPDGLYTPPSEKAMIYDIKKLKDLGFNTIRKHGKVEPFRYYYECDKIGMLVWQDMPSGNYGGFGNWNKSIIYGGKDANRTNYSKMNFYKEWGEIIDNLKFFQSIIIWTPFNEARGQFDTEKVVNFTRSKDRSRLINAASGGNHRLVGDFLDLHTYPNPRYILNYTGLINIIGEYGGIGFEVKNHTWVSCNWSYRVLNKSEDLTNKYIEYIQDLIKLVPKGISAAIYTQTTDVETEINGLITYDRKHIKISDIIKHYNQLLISSLNES